MEAAVPPAAALASELLAEGDARVPPLCHEIDDAACEDIALAAAAGRAAIPSCVKEEPKWDDQFTWVGLLCHFVFGI
eukprot:7689065-Pyramimonas_sp.AAC.2